MVESIERIIATAERARARSLTSEPGASELHEAADEVCRAAKMAQRRVLAMHSPFSIPKVRMYFLSTLGLVLLARAGVWIHEHLTIRTVQVALAEVDSNLLEQRVARSGIASVQVVPVKGSRSGLRKLVLGEVDAAVVQGGVELQDTKPAEADRFDNLGVVRHEHVLFLRAPKYRRAPAWPEGVRRTIVTLQNGEGSHRLGALFFEHWNIDVDWRHSWPSNCDKPKLQLPLGCDVDGVFVVVDLSDRRARRYLHRAIRAGFVLADASLGAYEDHLDYLVLTPVRRGYFQKEPPLPERDYHTYWVENRLMARRDLSAQQRADLTQALSIGRGRSPGTHDDPSLYSSMSTIMSVLANAFEAMVNFALIAGFVFSLEIVIYRRYIQGLSVLLTKLSLLQAERDMLGVADPEARQRNVAYLETCSDLLGLVSSIAGYYSHANTALAFNGLTGLVHVRANVLKLNIQLKLVQATVLGHR